jgi:hypothetical protein
MDISTKVLGDLNEKVFGLFCSTPDTERINTNFVFLAAIVVASRLDNEASPVDRIAYDIFFVVDSPSSSTAQCPVPGLAKTNALSGKR